jgi:hypothetical protein
MPLRTCESRGDPHFTTWSGSRHDFQGTGAFELATVPEAGLTVHVVQCRIGLFPTSNAAVALSLGGTLVEIFDESVHVDGAQLALPRDSSAAAGGLSFAKSGGGTVVVEADAVRLESRRNPSTSADAGYAMHLTLFAPIFDPATADVTGLCRSLGSGSTELTVGESLFEAGTTRLDTLLANCGIGEPQPEPCPPGQTPGVECCPSGLGNATALRVYALRRDGLRGVPVRLLPDGAGGVRRALCRRRRAVLPAQPASEHAAEPETWQPPSARRELSRPVVSPPPSLI